MNRRGFFGTVLGAVITRIFGFKGVRAKSDPIGEVYYISPIGLDAGMGTSVGTSWRTLSHAIDQTSPGARDTIIVFDGPAGETYSVSGNNGSNAM